MNIIIRKYQDSDIKEMIDIWNAVVEDGVAFPQEEYLTSDSGRAFFAEQTYTAVAEETDTGAILGLYILHPNNVGRCGHISNASYAVSRASRGLHIGERLVRDCLEQARAHGFRLLQFNAVVAANIHAIHLYERLGFVRVGTVPEGFRMKDGTMEDIIVFYHKL